jgi:undecaprenyl-diphosphatase
VAQGFATGSAATAILGYIAAVDGELTRRANWWRPPRWIRVWMICATRGGDGWLWYATGLLVLLFGGDAKWAAIESAALASGAGIALFTWLKRRIRRPRPCSRQAHCWSNIGPPDQFSFPSGHSITAFAVTAPLSAAYPELAPGFLFCASSVAASRVLLGMHYLSDVVAGSLIGALLGTAAYYLLA